jgi:hypothetical protein
MAKFPHISGLGLMLLGANTSAAGTNSEGAAPA